MKTYFILGNNWIQSAVQTKLHVQIQKRFLRTCITIDAKSNHHLLAFEVDRFQLYTGNQTKTTPVFRPSSWFLPDVQLQISD
jgi:hypothetical protein